MITADSTKIWQEIINANFAFWQNRSQASHCVKKIGLSLQLRVRNNGVVFKPRKLCVTMPMAVLISGHQSVNSSREAVSILSGKYNRFTFVHPGLCLDTSSGSYHQTFVDQTKEIGSDC